MHMYTEIFTQWLVMQILFEKCIAYVCDYVLGDVVRFLICHFGIDKLIFERNSQYNKAYKYID